MQRLSLGLPLDAAGLRQAERLLRQVVQDLQHQRFRWEDWGRGPAAGQEQGRAPTAAVPTGALDPVADFEAAFFADPRRRRNPAGSRTTWSGAYRPYLRRLQTAAGTRALSPELLEEVLESYSPGSRSRQQCGTALAALARHRQIRCRTTGPSGPPATASTPPASAASPATARSWRRWRRYRIPAGGSPTG